MDSANIPRHIAIIMDGNGRWAAVRRLPKIMGHKKGAETIRSISKACIEAGIEILTLFAFSTENWKRPKEEVDLLMGLLRDYLKTEKNELKKNGIKFMAIGKLEELPDDIRAGIDNLTAETSGNNKLILNLAINYGARSEIVDATVAIAKKIKSGAIEIGSINEETISNHLYTKGLPDPDLIIRTSGEMRLSNFLLWQASYSEIYVTKNLWPDFTKKDLISAINDYSERIRRFGA